VAPRREAAAAPRPAGADCGLPPSFDTLVEEVFGELLRAD
jgi:hypothetical protein